ncbi:MAG: 2-oxo-4-hydroxy-4-carboxy-5-ureidoimidazoline decarboxylase [Terrimesophilobacter sp.]
MPASARGTLLLLRQFNHAHRSQILAILRPCLAIERWVSEIADSRPYLDLDALLRTASIAASPFTMGELDAALAHHPRIGDRVEGTSTEARHSRAEQAGVSGTDATAQALADGNRAYERVFHRVFLIRAAGRSATDILGALKERLKNSAEEEAVIIETQLREIAAIRLRTAFDNEGELGA